MLAETATEAAKRFGDRPAFVTEAGWAITYEQLDRLSDEVAAGLRADFGVGEGSVVGLLLPPCPEHFVAYLALAKLGAVTAAVNGRLSPTERSRVLTVAQPDLVLATSELAPEPASTPGEVVELEESRAPDELLAGLRRRGSQLAPLPTDPDRPIAIVFTSGTTGTPKGATFCGRQFAFITSTDVGEGWGGGGPSLSGSALAHLGPMTKLAGNLRRGTTQHLTRSWKASETLRRVAELKLGAVGGVPTQLALMLLDPDFDQYDLSSVKAIVIGGGPAAPSLIREARERFGAPLAVRYSCTEAGIGTGTAFDDPWEDAEVSVGRPQRGVHLSIVDDEGQPVPNGEIGHVCLRSPAVMSGYWGDEEATTQALLADGSVRTGDLGYVDEIGRLRLAGRSKELYVRGGYNVHPMEVESVLADHPDVAAVAVVGVPDAVLGEKGVAVVVVNRQRPEPSLDSLRSFGADRLARYKLPDQVVVVEELPLTAMEKVDRRALAELLSTI